MLKIQSFCLFLAIILTVSAYDYKSIKQITSTQTNGSALFRRELLVFCKPSATCDMYTTEELTKVDPGITQTTFLSTFGLTRDGSKLILVTAVLSADITIQEYSTTDKTEVASYTATLTQNDPLNPPTALKIKASDKGKIVAIETSEGLQIFSSPFGENIMVIPNNIGEGFQDYYFFDNDTKIAIVEKNTSITPDNINPQIKIYDLTTKTLLQNINLKFNPKIIECSSSSNVCLYTNGTKTYKVNLLSGKQLWSYELANITHLQISEDGSRIFQVDSGKKNTVLSSDGLLLAEFQGEAAQLYANELYIIYADPATGKATKFEECNGFFNGSSECESCADLFDNCNICKTNQSCTECQLDYVLDKDNNCAQCPNTIDYTLSYIDTNSIILKFVDLYILNKSFQQNVFLKEICEYFFQTETLNKFGLNPKCLLVEYDDATLNKKVHHITVQFSYYSTFTENESVLVNKGAFNIENCVTKIETITSTKVTPLGDNLKLAPQAVIESKPMYTQCEPIIMSIRDIENDGKAELKELSWVITYSDPLKASEVVDINNTIMTQFNNQYMISIPKNSLQSNTSYIMNVSITNVFDKQTILTKEFTIGSEQMATIQIQNAQDKLTLKTWEQYQFDFKIEQQVCKQDTQLEERQVEYSVDLMSDNTFSTVSSNLLSENGSLISQTSGQYKIEPYQYGPNSIYYLRFSTKLTNNLQTTLSYDTLTLQIEESNYIVKILDGSRTVAVDEELIINAIAQDLDVNPLDSLDSEEFTLTWTCTDPQNNDAQCQLSDNMTSLPLEQNQLFQKIEVGNLVNLKIYDFTLTASKSNGNSVTDKITITVTDKIIPDFKIAVNIPKIILLKRINPNEPIDFQIDIPENIDPASLQYSVLLKYNESNVGAKQFNYSQFQLKISDIFTDFQSSIEQITLQVNVHDPQTFNSYSQDFILKINTPPSIGNIKITPETGTALDTEFTIQTANFEDLNKPITYKFTYFLSQQDFDNMQNQILISDYQPYDTVSTILSSSQDKINTDLIIIMVEAKDIYGSTSHSTQTLTIAPLDNNNVVLTKITEYINSLTNEEGAVTQTQSQKFQKLNIFTTELLQQSKSLLQDNLGGLNSASQTLFEQYLESTKDNLNLQDTTIQIKPLNQILKLKSQIQQNDPNQQVISQDQITQISNFFSTKIEEQYQKLSEVDSLSQLSDISLSQQITYLINESYQYSTITLSGYDSLFQFIQNNNQQRILQEETQNQLDQLNNAIKKVQQIIQILVAPLIPNSEEIQYKGQNISIKVQKLTFQSMQSIFTFNELYLTEQQKQDLEDGEQNQNLDSFDKNGYNENVYTYELLEFKNNPLKYLGEFPYPDQKAPLQQLQVKQTQKFNPLEGVPIILNPGYTYKVPFSFEYTSEQNIVCIQYQQENEIWSNENCDTYYTAKNEIQCECSTLEHIALVNDNKFKFASKYTSSEDNQPQVQTSKQEELDEEGNLWTSFMFFFSIVQILLLIVLITQGLIQDKKNSLKSQKVTSYKIPQEIKQNISKAQNIDEDNQIDSTHKMKPKQEEIIDDSNEEDNNIQEYGTSRSFNKKLNKSNSKKDRDSNEDENPEQSQNKGKNKNSKKEKKKKRKRTANMGQPQNTSINNLNNNESIQVPKQQSQQNLNDVDNDSIFNSQRKIEVPTQSNIVTPNPIQLTSNPETISLKYTFFDYHQFFSIYSVYRQTLSRPIRYLAVLSKYFVLFGLLSLLAKNDDININILRLLSVIIALGISIIPQTIALISQQNKIGLKLLGTIFSLLLFIGFLVIGYINGMDMTNNQLENWGDSYLLGLIVDLFISQSIIAGLKHFICQKFGNKTLIQKLIGIETIQNIYDLSQIIKSS